LNKSVGKNEYNIEWSSCDLRVPTPNPARSRQFRTSYAEAQHPVNSRHSLLTYTFGCPTGNLPVLQIYG